MKIGIVGAGTVGSALAHAYKRFGEVRVYDEVRERGTHSTYIEVVSCDLVFICLPETALDDWGRIASNSAEWRANMVLKSTVPIGTTRRLQKQYNLPNICHSPEFLSERSAGWDACNPKRLVIGSPDGSNRPTVVDLLYSEYRRWFRRVEVQLMTSDESEALKLFDNAFGAVKVSLMNEFRSLADKLGLNWSAILQGMLAGGRIHPQYTQVPGPDGRFGWGGRCFGKDMDTLIRCYDEAFGNSARSPMLQATKLRNGLLDRDPLADISFMEK